jgi:arginase
MSIQDQQAVLILSQFDIGAGKKGAADGPKALKQEAAKLGITFPEEILLNGLSPDMETPSFEFGKHITSVLESSRQLNDAVQQVIQANKFPLVFSGDHSNAIGGLSGLKNAFPDKRIGVIWIDAHADLHSPYTTPSGNLHGMPLAALGNMDNTKLRKNNVSSEVEHYWNELKRLGTAGISPKFNLGDLVFIGIRDAEKEEWSIIEDMGIRIFETQDIREHGIYYVINKSLAHLEACDLLYISFDVDSLDPSISVGTGTTSPDGLRLPEAEIIFRTLLNHPKTGLFEITEVNPHLDQKGKEMAGVIAGLLRYGLSK